MKFLHISDLHYHPDEDGRTSSEIREKLIKYLTDNGIFADELIITGDFRHALYSKKPIYDTVNDVKEYIMTIAKTIGIDTSECIHIIPGNHDRKRPKNMSRMNRIKTNYSYESGKFNLDDTKYINTQFEFFKELCKHLYGDNNFWEKAWGKNRLHTYRVINDEILLCLNTAIMHNSDKDRRHLIIGNYDLYMLLKDIKDNYPDYPIVVLAHHSPDYFDESEKQAVEHIFRDHPIELYLCGDAHIAWQRAINGCLEITMGCIKQEVGTEVAFLVGDTNLSDYTAHHWASGAWEPFTRVNEEIAQCYKTNSSSLNMISTPRKLAEKIFKTIVGLGRFKGYDQTDDKPITDIKDTILSNSKERTLEEIVFGIGSQFKENAYEYSVSLYGKGGSGKTHQFISLIKEILFGLDENEQLKYPDIIPYYLELNDVSELKGNKEIKHNVVLYELSKSMGIEQNRLERILERKGANVIIFADGMNEVTDDILRRAIAQSICKIRERYKTRIVLSSREDHSGLFNSLGRGTNRIFVKAEICELTEKQINDYFERVGISFKYHEIPKATRRLLLTAQGLSMYAEMSLDDPEKTLEFSTLGLLLQSYCDKIMVIDRSSPVSDLNFEKMLSFIAYNMVLLGKFELKSNILEELLDSEQLKELKENNKISLIFADHGKDDYEFSHQNFRDYYAGLYLAKHIKSINHNNVVSILDEFLGNNNATINDEILSMCSDFLDTSHIQDAIDCLKSINNNYRYSFQLSVLIRLYAFSNHNDISEMNLDSLDLRSVSLSNYKLYSKRGNSSICISLKESKISEDTFLQNGLQTASSTICRYTYKGEEYICAFSASNAQIYSIRNNTWRCVHNLPNNGWVNCCCVKAILVYRRLL